VRGNLEVTIKKLVFQNVFVLLCNLVLLPIALADTPASSPIPAILEPPANQKLAFTLSARGVQIYECRALPHEPTRCQWFLKAPEAKLFNDQGRKIGRHLVGPTWELDDGGKVVGKVIAKVDAPDGKGIPWLLLNAVETNGKIMDKVKSIQRVYTIGGLPPRQLPNKSDVGQEKRIEYSAIYRFFINRF
jgi:hypothetical protein